MHIYTILVYPNTLVMIAYMCYCYEVFTYPNFMNQNDRDFQKVLEALTEQDKKITEITNMITQSTGITLKAFEGQQKLNESQREVNHSLRDGLKDLFNAISTITTILTGGKN